MSPAMEELYQYFVGYPNPRHWPEELGQPRAGATTVRLLRGAAAGLPAGRGVHGPGVTAALSCPLSSACGTGRCAWSLAPSTTCSPS